MKWYKSYLVLILIDADVFKLIYGFQQNKILIQNKISLKF